MVTGGIRDGAWNNGIGSGEEGRGHRCLSPVGPRCTGLGEGGTTGGPFFWGVYPRKIKVFGGAPLRLGRVPRVVRHAGSSMGALPEKVFLEGPPVPVPDRPQEVPSAGSCSPGPFLRGLPWKIQSPQIDLPLQCTCAPCPEAYGKQGESPSEESFFRRGTGACARSAPGCTFSGEPLPPPLLAGSPLKKSKCSAELPSASDVCPVS